MQTKQSDLKLVMLFSVCLGAVLGMAFMSVVLHQDLRVARAETQQLADNCGAAE